MKGGAFALVAVGYALAAACDLKANARLAAAWALFAVGALLFAWGPE